MSVALICVVIAFLLNLVSKVPLAVAMQQQAGGYDNRNPRLQQESLVGWGRRALGAHLNGFEAFPAFAIGVLVATVAGGDSEWTDRLAVVFIAARCVYLPVYLAELHIVRSIAWTVGFVATLGLLALPILAPV